MSELAWAAGFFDGEGWCGLNKNLHPTLCVQISQTDRRPLDRFRAAVGLGKVQGPYRKKHKGARDTWKPAWYYQCFGVDAERVVVELWRWLSEPKREQAAAALMGYLPHPRPTLTRASNGRYIGRAA